MAKLQQTSQFRFTSGKNLMTSQQAPSPGVAMGDKYAQYAKLICSWLSGRRMLSLAIGGGNLCFGVNF